MRIHANARTCPKSRALIAGRVLEEGWSLTAAAEAAGVSERTAGGLDGLGDVVGVTRVGDRRRAPVDPAVPAGTGAVVVSVGRLDQGTDEPGGAHSGERGGGSAGGRHEDHGRADRTDARRGGALLHPLSRIREAAAHLHLAAVRQSAPSPRKAGASTKVPTTRAPDEREASAGTRWAPASLPHPSRSSTATRAPGSRPEGWDAPPGAARLLSGRSGCAPRRRRRDRWRVGDRSPRRFPRSTVRCPNR